MPDTSWFTNARFGLFLHWGLYSIPARGEWVVFQEDLDIGQYEKYATVFNPVHFDPEKWAALAASAGMKYVVFTTKHHEGFCMFDSRYTDYKITNTPYGKDITRELVEAFRKHGIRIGFYHSLVDWIHPHFIPDGEHPLGKYGKKSFPGRELKIYQDFLYSQIEQLLTDYGKIDLLFFDYTSRFKTSDEWAPKRLMEMVRRLQPDMLVNDRLSFDKKSFSGDYFTPEICVPNKPLLKDGKNIPFETCMTMNDHWGYCASDRNFKSLATVENALTRLVSMNGNLLLNIGPDSLGDFPPESIELLKQMAVWYERNGESVTGAGPASKEFVPPYGMHYTAKNEKNLYLHLTDAPMGDIILPGLLDKVRKITLLDDKSECTLVTWWGEELLNPGELRIRLDHPASVYPAVLKIELK